MVRVSSPAKLRPWSELTAKMVMGVVPGLATMPWKRFSRNVPTPQPGQPPKGSRGNVPVPLPLAIGTLMPLAGAMVAQSLRVRLEALGGNVATGTFHGNVLGSAGL